jgi:hypothetical protein
MTASHPSLRSTPPIIIAAQTEVDYESLLLFAKLNDHTDALLVVRIQGLEGSPTASLVIRKRELSINNP